jgi:hypothetical protein
MTDFLDRLVARTVEHSAVRPRVTSRFEQGPWADPATARRQAQEADGADDPPPPLSPPSDSPRLVPDPGRRHAAPRGALAPPRAAHQELLPVAATEPAASSPRAVARDQASRKRRALEDPDSARADPSPPSTAREVLAPPRQPVRPAAIRPTSIPAHVAADRPAPPPTADVVQVRIGRVEVRATVGRAEHPAPPAVRSPRARPLSLEAFLEGKRGRP